MSQQTITTNPAISLSAGKDIINTNFTELYSIANSGSISAVIPQNISMSGQLLALNNIGVSTNQESDNRNYLRRIALKCISDSKFIYTSGVLSGKIGYAPGGGYASTEYVRDFAMAVRGAPDAFSPEIISGHVALYCSLQGPSGQIYDAVSINGAPLVAGSVSPSPGVNADASIDNQYELVDLIYQHYLVAGKPTLYNSYKSNITGALAYPKITNNLVQIDSSTTPFPVIEFGFQDTIGSTGYVLMASVLRYRTLSQLVEMATLAGDTSNATTWNNQKLLISSALDTYLWDGTANLYRNASAQNTQHSIPGNAYAVILGIPSEEKCNLITQVFLDARPGGIGDLAGKGFYENGQIRHLPLDENWTNVRGGYGVGHYQNGAYWATFTGWVSKVLRRLSKRDSNNLLSELVSYFRNSSILLVPIEASCVATGYVGSSRYTVSATLPMEALIGLNTKDDLLLQLVLSTDADTKEFVSDINLFINPVNNGMVIVGKRGYSYSNNSTAAGSILLNNGALDAPGIKWATGDNTNLSIDVNNGIIRIIRNADESGGSVIATIESFGSMRLGDGSATRSTFLDVGRAGVAGNSILTDGHIIVNEAGYGFKIKEGSNARMGVSTLSAGTITISNNTVTSSTRIFVTRSSKNSSTAIGNLEAGTIINATSFVINSYKIDATIETSDVSIVNWVLFEPA